MKKDQEKIIAIFERHRKSPKSPYEENHFLDFLLDKPKQKRAVYNSFQGLKRYNAFINDIQLEFAICFSLKDFEANYALEKFVNRVKELNESPRSSLASLNNQMRPYNWNVAILITVIGLSCTFGFKNNIPIVAVLVAVVLVIDLKFLKHCRDEKKYNERLLQKIKAKNVLKN